MGQDLPKDSKIVHVNIRTTNRGDKGNSVKHLGVCFLPEARKEVTGNTTHIHPILTTKVDFNGELIE
jgi:hypothetical protein